MQCNSAGQVVIKLKTAWRFGTSHIVMSPLGFMQRLAARAPPRTRGAWGHVLLASWSRHDGHRLPVQSPSPSGQRGRLRPGFSEAGNGTLDLRVHPQMTPLMNLRGE